MSERSAGVLRADGVVVSVREVRMGKTIRLSEAVARIPDGARLMIGGFMGVGTPPRLIDETVRQGKKDLTIIANDTARPMCPEVPVRPRSRLPASGAESQGLFRCGW